MSAPRDHAPLPLDARRALWNRIWGRLLQPVADDRPADRTAAPPSVSDEGTGDVRADRRHA